MAGRTAAAAQETAGLELWQRLAVLAAASLLRDRFNRTPHDARARQVHDALLEVVEPERRTRRLQREMASDEGETIALRSERRARGRRAGTDRRVWEFGPPRGRERRRRERRGTKQRRESR